MASRFISILAASLFFSIQVRAQKNSSFTRKTFPMDKSALGVGYGPTLGAGLETAVKPHRTGVWAFAVLVPIRSSEAIEYRYYMIRNYDVRFENQQLPVAFSIGYKFILR